MRRVCIWWKVRGGRSGQDGSASEASDVYKRRDRVGWSGLVRAGNAGDWAGSTPLAVPVVLRLALWFPEKGLGLLRNWLAPRVGLLCQTRCRHSDQGAQGLAAVLLGNPVSDWD